MQGIYGSICPAFYLNRRMARKARHPLFGDGKGYVSMKRMCGFALFCFSMGMLVMLMIHNRFIGFFLVIICMLAGYYIFCCD